MKMATKWSGVLALAAGSVDRYVGQNRSIALSLLIIALAVLGIIIY